MRDLAEEIKARTIKVEAARLVLRTYVWQDNDGNPYLTSATEDYEAFARDLHAAVKLLGDVLVNPAGEEK